MSDDTAVQPDVRERRGIRGGRSRRFGDGPQTERHHCARISAGLECGDQQIVLGAAMPITVVDGDSTVAGLAYFSYELPFTKDR